jgi:uncharacterized membrane protein
MTERVGRAIFAWAIIAIGVESCICWRTSVTFADTYHVLPIMPYPPAIPALAILFGIVMIACGILMMRPRMAGVGVVVFAAAYVLAAVLFDIPRAMAHPADVTLRTLEFQPLTLAALAWTLPAAERPNTWMMVVARYAIAVSLIVYGADHFAILSGIASLVPSWIPFHTFWAAFCGLAFIAGGVGFAVAPLRSWASAGLVLMFGVFLVTIHIPAVFQTPRDPDAWCSIFIVVAFCGGLLANWAYPRRAES